MLAAGIARGQTEPSERTIIVPVVDVKAWPGAELPTTMKLKQGDKVKVLREAAGGWLAIKPPEGSFDWISSKLIKQTGLSGTVQTNDVPLRIGSVELTDEPLKQVSEVKLQPGTQVLLVHDKAVYPPGSTEGWLPIWPPPQEVRYIRADAVSSSTVTTAANAKSAAPTAAGGLKPAAGTDALWEQAVQAEKASNFKEACALWDELGKRTVATNNVLAMQYYNHSQYLRDYCLRNTSGYRPEQQTSVCYPGDTPPDGRLVPAATGGQAQPSYPPTGQATSQYTYVKDDPRATVASPKPAYGQPVAQAQSIWSQPGKLRMTAINFEGKQPYVLESPQGLMYVTPAQGVDLRPYVERNVRLFGPVVYHGQLRNNYMTVQQVQQLP